MMNRTTLSRELIDCRSQLENGLQLILPFSFSLGLRVVQQAPTGATLCADYKEEAETFVVTICDSTRGHAPYLGNIALVLRGHGLKVRRGLTDRCGSWRAHVSRRHIQRRVTLAFDRVKPHSALAPD